MRIELTSAFTTLAVSEGTLQNVSRLAQIELSSAQTENTGIVLNPGDILQFKSDVTLYARAVWKNAEPTEKVFLAHEPFKGKGEGGDNVLTYKGSVETYDDLPSTHNVGDVYNIETADETHGILAGDNVAWNGTSWDRLAGIYAIMQGATSSAAGKAGLVPVPAAGAQSKVLYGNGAWGYVPLLNAKVRLTTSGTYTAPVTGTYRITLVGGGGGGGGAYLSKFSGAGGGSGGTITIYEKMTAGAAYTYIIGAGGTGASVDTDNGTNGGTTSITINDTTTSAMGGSRGAGALGGNRGGGSAAVGFPGSNGSSFVSGSRCFGGVGGGVGGAHAYPTQTHGVYGGGGCGGSLAADGTALKGTVGGIEYDLSVGGNGGNGYIEIEYFNASLL